MYLALWFCLSHALRQSLLNIYSLTFTNEQLPPLHPREGTPPDPALTLSLYFLIPCHLPSGPDGSSRAVAQKATSASMWH